MSAEAERPQQESAVFIVQEGADVRGDAGGEQPTPRGLVLRLPDQALQRIVQRQQCEKQRHVPDLAPGVKDQARGEQKGILPFLRQEPVDQYDCRQEIKKEGQA